MSAAIVGAVFAGIGALSSIMGGRKADRDAKRAAAEEARLEGLVTREKVRQIGVEERVMRGDTIAAVAGSGVKAGEGSPLQILAEQAREFGRQRSIVSEVGATKAAAALTRGSMIGQQARYQSYSTASNQFAQMFSLLGQATANKPTG
jgi:hypothetical protein